ncbi:MAG: hypothetical protein HON90_03955, partial [Halobacteriovoraceae bacterium]|nr:hypothetical protein [Halobacteriovoraceae bacterium]
LAKTLKTYLKSSKIHQREAAYQNLKNQNLLTSKDEAIYQTMTLLADKNFLDHELDLAIISMKSLGSKPKLRLEILNQLKKIDPLPGKLFIKKSSIINQAKTRVFSRYFPEYIDFYAHTCIDYLSENKIFPLGNPTPYCHDLFSMNKKINILPATLTKQYSKATFFINSNSRK